MITNSNDFCLVDGFFGKITFVWKKRQCGTKKNSKFIYKIRSIFKYLNWNQFSYICAKTLLFSRSFLIFFFLVWNKLFHIFWIINNSSYLAWIRWSIIKLQALIDRIVVIFHVPLCLMICILKMKIGTKNYYLVRFAKNQNVSFV